MRRDTLFTKILPIKLTHSLLISFSNKTPYKASATTPWKIKGAIWYGILSNNFYFLSNITHIFIHFFIYIRILKNNDPKVILFKKNKNKKQKGKVKIHCFLSFWKRVEWTINYKSVIDESTPPSSWRGISSRLSFLFNPTHTLSLSL